MPADTVFFICDVCTPHLWFTVETGINESIDFQVNVVCVSTTYYIATVEAGIYDGAGFRGALSSATYNTCPGISVTYPGNNVLTMSALGTGHAVKIFTDDEIPTISKCMVQNGIQWAGGSYNGGYANACNDNIQNFTPLDADISYACSFLNLQTMNNIYITSPNLGSYGTVAPVSNTIIKKTPAAANYGYMIIDQYMSNSDFLDCSNQTLKTWNLELEMVKGT